MSLDHVPAPPRARELGLAVALLAAVAAAAFGWYVASGGFYGDDWGNAAGYRFAQAPRYWNTIKGNEHDLGGRPVLAALLPLPHALLGVHPGLHIALGVLLVVLTALAFYAFVRLLGAGAPAAAAMSVLALLFPWADAIELWPTAAVNTVAVLLFFVGGILALRGLEATGRRATLAHAGAAACFLLSVLTYEVAGAVSILLGVLYVRRVELRRALRLWCVDAVLVLAGLGYSLARTTTTRHVGTLHERISDVSPTTRQALSLAANAFVPAGNPAHVLRPAVLVIVACVLVAAIARRGEVERHWLTFTLGSVIGIAGAYFMFLGSYLHPLDPGTGSRTNVLARFAYAVLVYAVVALAAGLVPALRRLGPPVPVAIAIVIACAYVVPLARDESDWVRAAHLQNTVLAAIDRAFPRLDSGTTLATFGMTGEVGPGAPVFVANWDLTGAVDLARHDGTLQAEPIYERVRTECGRARFFVQLPGSRGSASATYRRLFFLDVKTGRSVRITSRAGCAAALREFPPGPFVVD